MIEIPATIRLLRPHHWVKNLLVFVPLVASHQFHDGLKFRQSLIAFLLFCLTASATYIVNDISDRASDRRHANKRRRPLAAGELSIPTAVGLATGLLAIALGASAVQLTMSFTGMLAGYFALTVLYSYFLRQLLLLDVLLLAALYGYRIEAGGVAADIPVSGWLLVFSGFFFLSIAFAKRYTELAECENGQQPVNRRGYRRGDLPLVLSLGSTCGYVSVLVFSLYIDSTSADLLYARPAFLWMICPLLLYWITRLWFRAHRGELHDDPVAFAARDPVTLALVLGSLVLVLVAR